MQDFQFTYTPFAGKTVEDCAVYLNIQLQELFQALTNITARIEAYPLLTSPPARLKVGMVAYADGTSWNPGSGSGLYFYKQTGPTTFAWVRLD